MRIATIVSLVCIAGALAGCGGSGNGGSVEFVASNTDLVLLDFNAKPAGELAYADKTATEQCQMFHRDTATLESLNVLQEGRVRATYLCKSTTRTAESDMKIHRQ